MLISFSCRDVANKRQTPLSCAAEAGKHDIVAYLLSISGVTTEGVNMDEVHFAVSLRNEQYCRYMYTSCVHITLLEVLLASGTHRVVYCILL